MSCALNKYFAFFEKGFRRRQRLWRDQSVKKPGNSRNHSAFFALLFFVQNTKKMAGMT